MNFSRTLFVCYPAKSDREKILSSFQIGEIRYFDSYRQAWKFCFFGDSVYKLSNVPLTKTISVIDCYSSVVDSVEGIRVEKMETKTVSTFIVNGCYSLWSDFVDVLQNLGSFVKHRLIGA